jgi:hypothetical protein
MAVFASLFGHVELPDPDADLRRPKGRRGDTFAVRRPDPIRPDGRR